MILAIWLIAAIFIALWSLAGWGLYAVLSTGTAWAGDLGPLIARIPYSAVVEAWVPGWIDTLKFIAALTQGGLSWLGGAAPAMVPLRASRQRCAAGRCVGWPHWLRSSGGHAGPSRSLGLSGLRLRCASGGGFSTS